MDSPERLSADLGNSRKGPNPNRDYKQHFLRQKQRFDQVTSEQVNHKRELSRASLKQMKLQDEIEFILDAIAGERHKRQSPTVINSPLMTRRKSPVKRNGTEEDVKPVLASPNGQNKEAQRQNQESEDDELDDLIGDNDDADDKRDQIEDVTNDEFTTPISTRSSGRHTRTSTNANNVASNSTGPKATSTASAGGSNKRPRRFTYSDSDEDGDEMLLESAGISTKRARNE